jgi:tetratricopeptide (TPR) repeat protein
MLILKTALLLALMWAPLSWSEETPATRGTGGAEKAPFSAGAAVPLDRKIESLQTQHAAVPDDLATIHKLAEALLTRARTSADSRDVARAEALIADALRIAANDPRSWTLKAWSEMTAHRFADALASARRAQEFGAENAITLGLISDALVELGKYKQAVDATQQMLYRFPGLPSYSRAAHLRFLHGDLEGAIALMRQAAQAGRPRTEQTAWTLAQLAELYMHDGQLEQAERTAQAAVETFPESPQVLAVLARANEAQGRFDDALQLYARAADAQPSPEFVYPLWKLAQRLDRTADAKRHETVLMGLARLGETVRLYRRVFALFFSEYPERLKQAEQLARAELQARPDIYSHDILA